MIQPASYLGPYGRLIALEDVKAEDVVQPSSSSFETALEGRVFEQRGPRARRTWEIGLEQVVPEKVAQLQALSLGSFGPPPWVWVDPWAQVTNLLSPEASMLEAGTFTGASDITLLGPGIMGDGVMAGRQVSSPTGGQVNFGYRAGVRDWPPVIPGLPVTGSLYVIGTGEVTLEFRTVVDGTAIESTHRVPFSANTFTRVPVTATPGAGAVCGVLSVRGATSAALPAVAWTREAAPWHPGGGCNRATTSGFEFAVQAANPNIPQLRRINNSFAVREIG